MFPPLLILKHHNIGGGMPSLSLYYTDIATDSTLRTTINSQSMLLKASTADLS
jgi:hypothetical protein